jgi:YHS domain-containing protein
MMTHIDPVCGMQVNQQNAAGRSAHQGKNFYFCSEDCKKQFDQDPEPYVQWEVREPCCAESGGAASRSFMRRTL